jgi:MtN3 and saliva related transmembrane protein
MHDFLGFIAASLTTFAFLPQVLKVVQTKSTHDISLLMYLVMTTGIFLWLVYGLSIHSGPLIFSNTLTLVFVGVILYFKVRYR